MQNLNPEGFDVECFRLFFSLSPDLLCITDAQGNFRYINPLWEQVFGFTQDELQSKSYFEFVHPDDKQKALALDEEVFSGREINHFESRFRCKDGSYRNLLWSCRKHPTLDLKLAIARDQTGEKQFIQTLSNQKIQAELGSEHLSTILSQLPALACIVEGPEHTFQFANQEYCQMLGNRNPIGLSVREVLPGIDESVVLNLDRVYATGEKFIAKELQMDADWLANGKIRPRFFTFIYSPLKNEFGQVVAIWCVAFDVTEVKAMQSRLQMSEKMASLGTLAAGLAHEVNNPLAYVMGVLELLLTQMHSESFNEMKSHLKEKIQSCQDGLERISDIVKSLKSFSRNDDEKVAPVEVREFILKTIKFVENEVKYRAQLFVDIEDGLFVLGNEGKLGQVFMNLIVNAGHSIQPGQVDRNEIHVRARRLSIDQVEISISDTGCGIEPQALEKIFEPFYTSKPVGQGTGLGLSICQSIINCMQGEIHVRSQVGVGSTFTVLIPALSDEQRPQPESIDSSEDQQRQKSHPVGSVLIVDDEVDFAEVLALSLGGEFETTVVHRVREALSALITKANGFDVIVCDLMMPDQTGIDFYRELSNQGCGLEKKIIFITGGVFSPDAKEFLAKVENPTIAKPFSMKSFSQEVRATLESQSSRTRKSKNNVA